MIPSKITLNKNPYKYFSTQSTLSKDEELLIISWMEKLAPWKLKVTDFYQQYEFSLQHIKLPPEISFLTEKEFIYNLKDKVESIFSVILSDEIDVVAHKLEKNQTIKIHNDMRDVENRETHRILFQLNKNFQEENGGFLLILDDQEIVEVIHPVSGSVQGFEISSKSNHAVSTVHNGERLTIVYSFRSIVSSLKST
ncbi:cyclophane-containing peptide 2OG-Fe(II) oxygenase YhhC [Pantoea agglomerans]|uniref:cyclophane-containing peptide 2OG-Fe(II) oxygenase YhhC n=1 Tax=Enterobacter agglomerans TaxID=549 RepID=UPI003C79B214